MKSKSFEIKNRPMEGKHNKTFDFVGFYKTAAETNEKLSEKNKSFENVNKENTSSLKTNVDTAKRERSPNKKKKKNKNQVDISHLDIDGQSLNRSLNTPSGTNTPVVEVRKVTSTPYANKKQSPRVKSIMKNSSSNDDAMDESTLSFSSQKPKKRNKSVSFMLDDTEEVVVKKTKSDESVKIDKKSKKGKDSKDDKKKFKKFKKTSQAEKENAGVVNMDIDPKPETGDSKTTKNKHEKQRKNLNGMDAGEISECMNELTSDKKKKVKKIKRNKPEESSDPTENESINNDEAQPATETKLKKLKKKKRNVKSVQAAETTETEGEPASKSRRKETKADIIAEDLENLSIGDNAHTLSNLLDEMTVVEKDKKKKNKFRRKKDKTAKTASVSSSETADLEKIEEGKEKVKWKKRKWNKDKKGDVNDDHLVTTIIVENLPLKMLFGYKKLLSDHFGRVGLIKKIGIAEVYPTEEPKPVFTTTITFYSDTSATKALEEDNTTLDGSRIRVRRPLPPADTTLVLRSYAELSDQSVSTVFTGAGRIRNIRHLVKGRKSMATVFIEFDGPESVERALKMAEDAKIGGKKVHVSKFEQRSSKKNKLPRRHADSENEGDSENSNE